MPPRDPSSAVIPYALRGEAMRDNIALRCRRHNQHEAGLLFGSEQLAVTRRGARSQAMPATTAAASNGRGA